MSAYESARKASSSDIPGVSHAKKPIHGDRSHFFDLNAALVDMRVPLNDSKAVSLSNAADDAAAEGAVEHDKGNSGAASIKAHESAHHIESLANHLIANHGSSPERALYASGRAMDIANNYTDSVVQDRDDYYRNGTV